MEKLSPSESTPEQRRQFLKALLSRKSTKPRTARLSFEQRRLFTLHQLDPTSSAYNLLNAYRIEGPLDVAALRSSLEQVVHRHEPLRTAFVVRNGEPVQVVQDGVDLGWAEIDLRAVPAPDRWARAHKIACSEAARPFDLTSGRVLRPYLLRLQEDVCVLLLVLHHIVADVWSFKVLNDELEALYRSCRQDEGCPLGPLSERYADFAAWQGREVTEEILEQELRQWEGALEGMEVLELASDFPRPPVQTHRGAKHVLWVPKRLQAGLERIARENDVSLFVARLAVFQTLLYRYVGSEDLNCGVPVANRPRLETERMIGFFVNTAVLRTSMADDPSFLTVLQRLRQAAGAMVNNPHVPFDRLVERLRPQRDPSRNPLYQITFQTGELPPLTLDGLRVTSVFEQDYGIVRSDLEAYVGDDGKVLLVYNRDLYRPETIEGLGRSFLRLWDGIVDDPRCRVSDLPLLSAAERQRVSYEWNDTAAALPGDSGIHELFEAQARETPHAVAAAFEHGRISYDWLNRRANRLGHYLVARGIGPEVPVALRMERSLEMVVALLAVLKAGGAYVPVSPQQPRERLAAILEDSGAALVLTGPSAEGEVGTGNRSFVDLFRLDLSSFPEEDLPRRSAGRNLAYLVYTSGSTGRPKGVLVEHRSAVHLGHAMGELCYRDEAGRKLRATLNAPIDFDASVQQILLLTRGHLLEIVPDEVRLDGPAFVRQLVDRQVEVLDCTPAHLGVLIDAGLLDRGDVGLRRILAAGGAIDRRTWDRLALHPTIRSYDVYGPTECTVNATGHPITRAGIAPRIGRPLQNYVAHLLDLSSNPVPNGVAGEIHLGGEGVARGYVALPGLTAAAFVPNPFGGPGDRLYRTGDFARRLDDDTLEFLGRRDDQVKIRGIRIELGEIEAQILSHETVREAAVLVVGDGDGRGEEHTHLVGYVVPAEPRPDAVERLRADLEAKLPASMIPSRFVVLETLPLKPNGKLDRAALPRPSNAHGTAIGARSQLEQSLQEIWAGALGVDLSGIGGGSNFFELGGHSLLATRITSRIRDVLQVEIPPRALFSHPTLGELAKLVVEHRSTRSVPLPPIEPCRRTSPPPLSFAQERLWFLDQLDPGLAAYNVPVALALDGALDPAALEGALRSFVHRHEAMRTCFALQDDRPVQVILSQAELHLPFIDLAGLSPERREPEIRCLVAKICLLPFDLGRYPLFRFTLVHLEANRHLFLGCLHHTISDAWSIRLMMEELSALYGDSTPLEALPVSYSDYAVWQRRIVDEGLLDDHLAFWRDRLAPEPSILSLPLDRPRPPAFRYRGGNLFFTIPAREMDRVARAAVENGVTSFMFLAAALHLLLSRYSGEEDIWLGSPVANRGRGELEGLVGPLINMVVLRGDLNRRQTVRELLRQSRGTILDASDHQDLPFEHVVDALNPERSLSYSPLFQCMLTFQSHTGIGLDLEGVTSRLLQVENPTAKLDLTFDLSHGGGALEGRVEFSTDVLDRVTILRLTRGLARLVREMALQPDAPVGELPLLDAAEHRQMVCEWNDTDRQRSDDPCIHQLFERQAAEQPHRVAVVCGEASVSYGELNARANRLAWSLICRCRDPRAKIAIFLPRSVDMVVAALAVLKAGKTYVPLDAVHPPDRIRRILEASGAEMVLTDFSFGERLAGLEIEGVRLGDPGAFAASPVEDPPLQAGAEDLAYVIFTSGSTGDPKGVVLQHRPVVNVVEWVNETHGVGERDGLLFITSLCFDLSVYDLFGTLAAGATVFVADDEAVKDPEILLELLCTRPITFWDSAPAALMQLVPLFDPERSRRAGLRLVFLSGDWIPLTLPAAVTEAFPGAQVIGLGGATEAAIWSNHFPVDGIDSHWKSIPYGRPIRNARYQVLDAGLHPCSINVAGDLYIGGGCLSLGYLNQPVQTARQYLPDPFALRPGAVLYATGDRSRWRMDGNLEFLGRVDAQVKIRGFRIELGEIEAVLEREEEVRKAVVLARADRPGDRRLVAYVQPRDPEQDAVAFHEDLLRLLTSRLPGYMVPSHLVFLDRWPVTANGKLDRKALPAPCVKASGAGPSVAAESREQEALARIWAQVLGVEHVGVHDNFFALGGDSILAIQIVARSAQAGLAVRPRDFFQAQTIAAMLPAGPVEGPRETPRGEVVAAAAATPIQRWFFDRQLEKPQHFNQSVLLEWKEPLDSRRLWTALRRIGVRHDALRLRFVTSGSSPHQRTAPPEAPNLLAFGRVDLTALPPGRLEPAIEGCATAVQGSLDPTSGPLVAACVFDTAAGVPPSVLLAVHHLGIDGVSWRILLEDLESLYRNGVAPGEAGSWMAWTGGLERAPLAERFRPELAYWLRQGRRSDVDRDFPGGDDFERDAETVVACLSREETELLERRVPPIYRTRMTDVLVAALAQAFHDDCEAVHLSLDMEGHGRSPELGEADPSRTVGWFTTLHPVTLEVAAAAAGPGTLLKSVKEQLRAVPHDGVGYGVLRYLDEEAAERLAALPRPEILFNYLGRFDGDLLDNRLYRVHTDGAGRYVAAENRRSHLLEINSLIEGGSFETRWRFSRGVLRRSTVERLVKRFTAALRTILDHCLTPDAGGRTPSDFPLAEVGQDELDLLFARHPDLEDLYPATPMQRGMLFHGELEPETSVYVQQISLEIPGALDIEAFRAAWEEAIARHASLRTVFWIAGHRHLQATLSRHASFWNPEDWRTVPVAERQERLERFLEEDLARRFDTANEPPLRVSLLRIDDRRHRLILTFHHAVLDGWSLAILMEEISTLYLARTRGRSAKLGPAGSVRDHAAWLSERDAHAAAEFWRRYLAGFRKPSSIAGSGSPAPAERRQRSRRMVLPPELSARIESSSRELHLTQSTIFQAAWALLVSRYASSDDVVVGVTTSGRDQGLPGIERMLGLFINTLPLRVATGGDRPVDAWLREVHRTLIEIRQREDSSLAEIQGWSELPQGQPLFESIVVMENYPFRESLVADWLGHGAKDVQFHERANYPLSLLVELRSEVVLEIKTDARYFGDAAVRRMLRHLEALLGELSRPDGRALAGLEVLDAGERHQVVVEANDSHDGGRGPDTLVAAVARQAAATPGRVAVTFQGEELRYAELVDRFERLARHLRNEGVKPGDRVALWMERSVEAVVAILAIQRAGAAHVPLDPEFPAERVDLLLRDSGAKLVLTRGPARAAAPTLDVEALDLSRVDLARPLEEVDPCFSAYVIYTSGSTGMPKGVVVEHRSAMNLLDAMQERVYTDLEGEGLRLSVNAPFGFDASIQQLVMLGRGHTLHVVPMEVRKDGEAFVDFLARERIGGLDITPTHLEILLEAGLLTRRDLSLKRVVVAGGAVHPAMWDRLAGSTGARFFNLYGPTECTVNATGCAIEEPGMVPSIGRALANYRVYVLDGALKPLPMGVPGQLFIGGRGPATGYHRRPGLTAERFVPDPFSGERGARLYLTGDLVRTLDHGGLGFLRRTDLQVKIRGLRVEVGEIEDALLRHPEVSQAVVELDSSGTEAMLVAYYTAVNGREVPRSTLRAFLRRTLPEYMVPGKLVRLDGLPLSPSGKVARKELPPLRALRRRREPPAIGLEERLVAIWAETLRIDVAEVGVLDDFLSLGGHSLNAALLQSRLRDDLGVELALKALYEGATIRDTADRVAEEEARMLGSDQALELLEELQGLSEAEIRQLLERENLEGDRPRLAVPKVGGTDG